MHLGDSLFNHKEQKMNSNRNHHKLKNFGAFFLFAGPSVFFFVMTIIVPFCYGLYLTFTDWNGISKTKGFVGFSNYVTAFQDIKFWASLGLTLIFTVISVFLVNYVAFHLARLVTSGIKKQNFFRAAFFTPNLIGGVVLGYIWQFVFGRALVALGDFTGLEFLQKSWLSSTIPAVCALIIVTVWQYSGYMMLIYIAGFMNIPQSLTEASRIDGCTEKQTRKFVVMPLMIPSFMVCIFLSITRCFMTYDLNLSLTEGNPFGSTVMASMYVYRKAFSNKNYGMGQTEAIILFVVCAMVSLLQVYLTKKREVEA